MSDFSGTVRIAVKKGMLVRINPNGLVGLRNAGKEFVVDGSPRELCGTEVVALNNLDGTRFSDSYDLSMLQVTDTRGL